MSFATPDEARRHRNAYLVVFVALACLTGITVWLAYLDFAKPVAVAIALLVATVKGGLVAAFFMHLISEKKAIYWTLGLCAVLFTALLLLPVLTQGETVSWVMRRVS